MKIFAVFMLSVLLIGQAQAESYIYLTNSTMDTLTIDVTQSGHDNVVEGNEWEQLAYEVAPLATVKFLRFNRDEGIKWGKTYYFDSVVSGPTGNVVLRQKLEGTWNFSKMWLTAESDPWYYDRDIHNIPMAFEDQPSTLAFRSQVARTSGDDIYYVINNDWQPTQREPVSNNFKVLTYNTWALLPGLIAKNTHDRLHGISDLMKGYDAVVFQEVFDPILTAEFRDRLQEEYPYLTEIPFKLGKILTGGSFIASRWPVLEQDTQVYDACRNDGCFASKGINYAKINKGGQIYHLFGTHTHAYTTSEDIAVRMDQLAQMKRFVDSKNIPAGEPVLMAGDFNVDRIHFPAEREDMLSILDASEPEALGEYPYSYAGLVNVYADDVYNEFLDYVLYSNQHLAPLYSYNRLRVPRLVTSEHWGSWDLSDHFPVESEFVFPVPGLPVAD
ncbi:endonuclease [Hahella sp. CCB-MM4]|uniref:sphingomyelin phosphodiesterase n=1 Tax=Hahella sp. (strain CCB-MM4) TaxID=1926491 RepID=UPI000B9B0AE2|nr:sphingomyelin phosphodiesterase [Hahella sp. CCB-MM4]OZG72563.1 endonuclease [Hahella sp. CCB-MM4]